MHTGEAYAVICCLSPSPSQSLSLPTKKQKQTNKNNRNHRTDTHCVLSNADAGLAPLKSHLPLSWTLLLSIVYAGAVVLIRCGIHSQHRLSLLLWREQRRKDNKSQLTLLNANGNPISFQEKKNVLFILSLSHKQYKAWCEAAF